MKLSNIALLCAALSAAPAVQAEIFTFTGDTTVAAGTLVLGKSAGVDAVGGGLVVSGGELNLLGSFLFVFWRLQLMLLTTASSTLLCM